MARGVPLGDHMRRTRLVRHHVDTQLGRFQEAQAIALGASGHQKAEEAFREFMEHLFPFEMDEETIEQMRQVIEQESEKTYEVAPKK